MKVLLINPEFPDSYWGLRRALEFEGKRSAYPPLGLLTVSAMLPRVWERRLVDMEVQPLRAMDIAWADIVFITGMIVQKQSMNEVVTLCKAQKKRVVIGGPYITTSPGNVPEADHIFLGEAEATLPEFVKDLEAGTTKRIYKAAERPSLALTPVPDFELADLRLYSAVNIQYSRGCPFNCEFCDIIEMYGRVPRTKSNKQVVAELDALYRLNWRGSMFIVDDNFIGNKRNVRKLLPDLSVWQERHSFPFSFYTEASVNIADDDTLLGDMRQAGFYSVFLGIETPVEESLIETQKTQNTKRSLLESVKKLQGYGLAVMAGFIVGFDSDPDDIFELQIDFIRASAIPMAMVGILNALPDTQLWRRLQQEGRLLNESSGNHMQGLNFMPRMVPEKLIKGYRSLVQTLYSSSEYYTRTLDCLRRMPSGTHEPSGYGPFRGAVILGRIIWRLGILDRDRVEFWRYLYRIATEHRDRFVQAIRFAAIGYHFRTLKLCKEPVPAPIEYLLETSIVENQR